MSQPITSWSTTFFWAKFSASYSCPFNRRRENKKITIHSAILCTNLQGESLVASLNALLWFLSWIPWSLLASTTIIRKKRKLSASLALKTPKLNRKGKNKIMYNCRNRKTKFIRQYSSVLNVFRLSQIKNLKSTRLWNKKFAINA